MDPQDPRLSSSAERERSAAKDKGTEGQYVAVCSVSNSPLTHNPFVTLSQPFRIKCERYILLKKCVRSSLLCWLCFRMYMYIVCICLWLCNICTSLSDFLKTTMGDVHFLPPEGRRSRRLWSINFFIVLQTLMTRNVLVNFVPPKNRGNHFLLILNSLFKPSAFFHFYLIN